MRAVCCGVRLVAPAAPIKLCEVVSVCPAPVSCPGGGSRSLFGGGGMTSKTPCPPSLPCSSSHPPGCGTTPSRVGAVGWVLGHPLLWGGPCVCPPPRPFFSTCPSLSPALGSEAGAVLSSSPRGGREEAGAATSPGPSRLAPPPHHNYAKLASLPRGGASGPPLRALHVGGLGLGCATQACPVSPVWLGTFWGCWWLRLCPPPQWGAGVGGPLQLQPSFWPPPRAYQEAGQWEDTWPQSLGGWW